MYKYFNTIARNAIMHTVQLISKICGRRSLLNTIVTKHLSVVVYKAKKA